MRYLSCFFAQQKKKKKKRDFPRRSIFLRLSAGVIYHRRRQSMVVARNWANFIIFLDWSQSWRRMGGGRQRVERERVHSDARARSEDIKRSEREREPLGKMNIPSPLLRAAADEKCSTAKNSPPPAKEQKKKQKRAREGTRAIWKHTKLRDG